MFRKRELQYSNLAWTIDVASFGGRKGHSFPPSFWRRRKQIVSKEKEKSN